MEEKEMKKNKNVQTGKVKERKRWPINKVLLKKLAKFKSPIIIFIVLNLKIV